MKKTKHQHGSNPTVIVLILIALGIVGLVAWRVYDSTAQTDKSLANATATSNVETMKDGVKEEAKTKKIVIPYVDYEVEVPDSIKDLTFSNATHDGVIYVGVTTKDLERLDPGCGATNGAPLGTVIRGSGKYENTSLDGRAARLGGLVKQYDDHFISYSIPQAACSADDKTNSLAEKLLHDFTKALGIN